MDVTLRWVLRLYPAAWRGRYEDEFLALLEDCPRTPRVWLDIIAGGFDARLHTRTVLGGMLSMTNRLRSSEIAIFCAYILFVLSGMGFQKMSEDFVHAQKVYPAIGTPFYAVVIGAIAALVAVLAGGLPLAFAALSYALRQRRRDIILLFLVPPAALAVWLGYVLVLLRLLPSPDKAAVAQVTQTHVWAYSMVGLLVLAAVVSTAAVAVAVSRAHIGEAVYRFALLPSVVTVLAMAIVLAAVVAWGIGAQADAPQLFNGNHGFLATSTAASWYGHIITMGTAVVIGIASLARGFGAGRTPHERIVAA